MRANAYCHRGFTLLEVLIVMGLLVVILGAIWGIVETFSRSFVSGEIRAERSQLVRSLSQLVTDDLSCAIQDPLHPAREANAGAVRRFGLSGTNTSMRIDVMQINPFRTGGMTSQYGVQAPELKTVYYDFAMYSPNGGGLTRRELDFETPAAASGPSQMQGLMPNASGDGFGMSEGIGSDTPTLADYGSASLTDRLTAANESRAYQRQQSGAMTTPQAAAAQQAMQNIANEQLQLEMSAPEVVGCWFRYYDGSQWHDNWNSLDRKGLPAAIEITLKLMPMVDATALRENPMARQVVNGPVASSMMADNDAAYARQYAANRNGAAGAGGMATGGGMAPSLGDYAGGTSLADYGEAPTQADRVVQQNSLMRQPMGLTVEQLAERLELSPPSEQRIIVCVPTTPLASQQELQREQPQSQPVATAQSSRMAAPQRQAATRSMQQSQRGSRDNRSRQTQSQPQSPDWIRQ